MRFVGRDKELDILKRAWHASAEGVPQFVCFVAESRFGKTRLVQEFYRWLNTHEDPGNYWPDTLEVGNDSLQINPSFDGHVPSDSQIPWLWWGIRWTRSVSRNASEGSRCAVFSDAHHVRPHLDAAMRARDRADAERRAWVGVGKSALNLAGNAASFGAVGPMIEMVERFQDLGQIRRSDSAATIAVDRLKHSQQSSELENLAELLVSVGIGTRQHPGIPIVLVLDDAHWADAASLRFLDKLLEDMARRACENEGSFRILAIATSWEREWEMPSELSHRKQGPTSLRDLTERLQIPRSFARTWRFQDHRLEQLDASLIPVVSERFVGLSRTQAELVAGRANGNPGLLAELLDNLELRGRHYFVDMRLDRPLTKRGEAKISRMSVDYHRLIVERLQDLSVSEALVLQAASRIGTRFPIHPVIDLLARAPEGASIKEAAVHEALEKADKPFAFIQKIAVDVAEFRTQAYREVLREQLRDHDLDSYISAGLPALLCSWLDDENVSFQEHSQTAQQVLLEFAEGLLAGNEVDFGESRRQLQFVVASEVLCRLLVEGRVEPIRASSATWLSCVDGDASRPGSLSARRINGVLSTLLLTDQRAAAQRVAEQVLDELKNGEVDATSADKLAVAHAVRGEVFFANDDWARALDSHVSAVQCLGKISPRTKSWRERMIERHLSIGDILFSRDAYEAALRHYRRSAVHARKLVRKYGTAATHLREFSSALSRIADAYFARRQIGKTLELRRLCADIDHQIIREHGATAERLREAAVSDFAVAEVLAERGETEQALDLFRQCETREAALLTEYGANASRRRDYCRSKSKVADMLSELGKFEEAEAMYHECTAINEALLDQNGENAADLRALSVDLSSIGTALLNLGYLDKAEEQFRRALQIDHRALSLFDENAESWLEIAHDKSRLADVEAGRGNIEAALDLYTQSEAIAQRLVDQHGLWGNLAQSLAGFKKERAGMLHALDRLDEALDALQQALSIWQQLTGGDHGSAYGCDEISQIKLDMADVRWSKDQIDEAVAAYRECVRTNDSLIARFGETANRLGFISVAKFNVAAYSMRNGRYREAQKLYEECTRLESDVIAKFGSTAGRQASLYATKLESGVVLEELGRYEEALAIFRECLLLNEEQIRRFGDSVERKESISRITYRVATALFFLDDARNAITMLRRCVTMDQTVIDEYGRTAARMADLSCSKTRLADALMDIDQVAEALTLYTDAEALDREQLRVLGATGNCLHSLSVAMSRIADVLLKQDSVDEAIARYAQCVTLQRSLIATHGVTADRSEHLAHVLAWYADALMSRNAFDESLALYEESLALDESAIDLDDEPATRAARVLRTRCRIADIHGIRERQADALAAYQECLATARRLYRRFGPGADRSMDIAYCSCRLADAFVAAGRLSEAQALFRRSTDIIRRVIVSKGESADLKQELCLVTYRWANVLGLRGRHDEAARLLAECIAGITDLARNHGNTVDRRWLLSASKRRLADGLSATGNAARAFDLWRHCVQADEALVLELGDHASFEVLENLLMSKTRLAESLHGVAKGEASDLLGDAIGVAGRLIGIGVSPRRHEKELDRLRNLLASLREGHVPKTAPL